MKAWLERLAAGGARKRALPIGVDFAAERLNMLQVEPGVQGPLVRAAVSLPYPVERAHLLADRLLLRGFVREALAGAPFAGRRVVAALAPAEVRILPLTVHVPGGQSEQQAVARAVRDQLGAAAAESVVDYYQVRSAEASGPEKHVLAAVAPVAQVTAYLDALHGAQLEPVALDIGPAAIARLLAAMQHENYEQSVLLINFGASKSFLTVIWGRRLMLDREIDFGETQLVDKLARALGLDAEVALALLREHGTGAAGRGASTGGGQRDIGRTIREILYPEFAALAEELVRTQVYVASRTRGGIVSRVYLNGSVARYAQIPARIEELVHLPVEVLDPFKAFGAAPEVASRAQMMHGIALAAGLALRGENNG
jgi:type IV pilus assembly protein PilM